MKDVKMDLKKGASVVLVVFTYTILVSISTAYYMDNYGLYSKLVYNKNLVENNTRILGEYIVSSQNIVVYTQDRTPNSVVHTAYHEVCHYAWHEWMTKEERQVFIDYYNGSDNVGESFAVGCADYLDFFNGRGRMDWDEYQLYMFELERVFG